MPDQKPSAGNKAIGRQQARRSRKNQRRKESARQTTAKHKIRRLKKHRKMHNKDKSALVALKKFTEIAKFGQLIT